MTSINRTAYPHFSAKRGLTRQEIESYYTLTSDESAIAELRKNNYELPAFEQLDRLVKHTRASINRNIFQEIYKKLNPEKIIFLETILKTQPGYNRTGYNGLKQLPKKPIITHFKELIEHHQWLSSFDNVDYYLDGIAKVKLQQFAEQAKSLDASDLKAAQHIRAEISAHMLSWINRRHITPSMLDKARERLINCINTFKLITAWGDGKSCDAGDGNLRELYE